MGRGLFLDSEGRLGPAWRGLLFLLLSGLLHAATGALLGPGPPRRWTSAAILLLASWLFLQAEGRGLTDLGLRLGGRWAAQALLGAALGFLLMTGTALAIRGLDGFHWEPGQAAPALGAGAWVFLGVALREELLFRGYAFQRLAVAVGSGPALVLGAFAFALAHWGNPGMAGAVRTWATLDIGLAGALLGLCYLKTRSLAMSIGLHLSWNWTQGSLLGFQVSGLGLGGWLRPVLHDRPQWLTGGSFGLEASLPCALLAGLALGALARWHPRS